MKKPSMAQQVRYLTQQFEAAHAAARKVEEFGTRLGAIQRDLNFLKVRPVPVRDEVLRLMESDVAQFREDVKNEIAAAFAAHLLNHHQMHAAPAEPLPPGVDTIAVADVVKLIRAL